MAIVRDDRYLAMGWNYRIDHDYEGFCEMMDSLHDPHCNDLNIGWNQAETHCRLGGREDLRRPI